MAGFGTTQWSQVLAAGGGSDPEARAALESLCGSYWYPLYAFVRHRGFDRDEASDLTQDFFEHLLETNLLQVAKPGRGRFRSFLLTSLRNFLSHQRGRAQALKRGGGSPTISLDSEAAETRFRRELTDEITPAVLFERRWAMTVMERGMTSLERQERESGNLERFEHLRAYLTGSRKPYRQAAQSLGMTEAGVGVAVHRLRKRFGEVLRSEIAATVAGPDDVDDELEHLLRVVIASPL